MIHDPDDPLPISIHGLLDTRDEYGPGSAAFTLGVAVETTYGFTSVVTTLLFAAATRLPGAPSALARISAAMPRPTGVGAWLIAATTGRSIAWATGTGQANGTAFLASLATLRLTHGASTEPGINYLHRTLRLDPATIATLSAHGIAVATEHPQ